MKNTFYPMCNPNWFFTQDTIQNIQKPYHQFRFFILNKHFLFNHLTEVNRRATLIFEKLSRLVSDPYIGNRKSNQVKNFVLVSFRDIYSWSPPEMNKWTVCCSLAEVFRVDRSLIVNPVWWKKNGYIKLDLISSVFAITYAFF